MENKSHSQVWEAGNKAYFEYHCIRSHGSAVASLWYRDHQQVTILGRSDQRDDDEDLFKVEFEDGYVGDAFGDELLSSPDQFDLSLEQPNYCMVFTQTPSDS